MTVVNYLYELTNNLFGFAPSCSTIMLYSYEHLRYSHTVSCEGKAIKSKAD